MTDHSESLMTALAKAQAEFPAIAKTKKAKVRGTAKGSGKAYEYEFEYADLADVLSAVRPILAKHGIALTQDFTDDGNHVFTELWFGTESVQRGRYPVKSRDPDDPQKYAGAVTFAKRYSLNMALGLHADDLDADELNGSMGKAKEWDPGEHAGLTIPAEEYEIDAKGANAEDFAKAFNRELTACKTENDLENLLMVTARQRGKMIDLGMEGLLKRMSDNTKTARQRLTASEAA